MNAITPTLFAIALIVLLILASACTPETAQQHDVPPDSLESVLPIKINTTLQGTVRTAYERAKAFSKADSNKKALDEMVYATQTALVAFPPGDTMYPWLCKRLSIVQRKLGLMQSALASLETGMDALRPYATLSKRHSLVYAELLDAAMNQYSRCMYLEKAIDAGQKAAAIRKHISGETDHLYSESCQNLGIAYQNAEMYRAADSCFQIGLAIEREHQNHEHLVIALINAAGGKLSLQDSTKAIAYFKEAYPLLDYNSTRIGYHRSEVYNGLARSQCHKLSVKAQTELYEKAEKELISSSKGVEQRQIGLLLLQRADCHLQAGYDEEALAQFHRASTYFSHDFLQEDHEQYPEIWEEGSEPGMFPALAGKGDAWLMRGGAADLENAMSAYHHAFDYALRARDRFSTPTEREDLLKQVHPKVEQQLECIFLGKEHNLEWATSDAAFLAMETERTLALMRAWESSITTAPANLPADKIAIGQRLYEQIARIKVSADADSLRMLPMLETQLNSLRMEMAKLFPDAFFPKPKVAEWKKVKEYFQDQNTLLLQYFSGESYMYVLAAWGQKDTLYRLPITDEVKRNIKTAELALTKDPTGVNVPEYAAAGAKLYDEFVRPATSLATQAGSVPDRVLLSPDGDLVFLPFEMLLYEHPRGPLSWRNLPYTLYLAPIQYVSSLSEVILDTSPPLGSKPMISFGLNQSPRPELANLAKAEDEALEAARKMDGEYIIGNECTEAKLKQKVEDYRHFLISLHGTLDSRQILNSAFHFYRDTGSAEDGSLTLQEVISLRMHADLAVLNTCHSGGGQYILGMGVLGMGWAFKVAGCRNLILSLSNLSDNSSHMIMAQFYDQFLQGHPAQRALQLAKIGYLRQDGESEEFYHPSNWAMSIFQGPGTSH